MACVTKHTPVTSDDSTQELGQNRVSETVVNVTARVSVIIMLTHSSTSHCLQYSVCFMHLCTCHSIKRHVFNFSCILLHGIMTGRVAGAAALL